MTNDPAEVVTVYAGSYVAAEAYQSALQEAGIESKLVGDALLASFGSAIPKSIELWVHQKDAEKARAVIQQYDAKRGQSEKQQQQHPHPTSDPKPGMAPRRKEPYVNPDPSGQ